MTYENRLYLLNRPFKVVKLEKNCLMKHQFHETIILSLELKSVKKGKIELTVRHQMERKKKKRDVKQRGCGNRAKKINFNLYCNFNCPALVESKRI